MNDLKIFQTTSLYIAAALLTQGRELLGVERPDPAARAVFRFAEDADGTTKTLAQQYQNRQFPAVQPRTYVNAIFDCRDLAAQTR